VLPAYLAAHEHVHDLQAQLGCFAGSEHHEWQWLVEGMATQLACTALVEADLVTAQEAELAIWEYRGCRTTTGPSLTTSVLRTRPATPTACPPRCPRAVRAGRLTAQVR
jgi:hypothetical protein